MNYISFFSTENIIRILCKYRAKAANKRHEKHMMRDISLHVSTNKILSSENNEEFQILQDFFPKRRQWIQLNESERKSCNSSIKINELRLYKSYIKTKENIKEGKIDAPEWYLNLLDYVEKIQLIIINVENSDYVMSKPQIRGIKKKIKKKVLICRPIALYDITDKIICSLTAKYLTQFFEHLFLDCSYAFRAKNNNNDIPTHHDCIQAILDNRKKEKDLWVAECDIQKFFDTVQHEYLLKIFDNLSLRIESEKNIVLDNKAKIIFKLFLDSFSFQENILSLNSDPQWFNSRGLPNGNFDWVEKELNDKFGDSYTSKYILGVPQGNAISCFISNLILHNVDEKVLESQSDVFYLRYCDDMVLMHKNNNTCRQNLDVFMTALHENFLLYHNPKKTLNYKERKNSLEFWDNKSKEPFYWGNKHLDENNIPWVSFVGYQVNFYGKIRVRKATLRKETKKQTETSQKVLKALGKLRESDVIEEKNSRKSINQLVSTLQQKLISMSVGRVNILNHKNPQSQALCWTNGFKKLSTNKITSTQLKYLDRRRRIQLKRIPFELREIKKRLVKKDTNQPKTLDEISFKGGAFSYYNFLKHKK
ncbi:putative RNA-directed DNA polymerase [Flavobacterium collinsii]|uniref:RNA-directed DNA polymerase n=2 Tax=Flavobacterium collinsii TaxID=1114861 RepID=A0A9W4TLM3_9FLAO|nr:putative RNA-directed DNA polymerase [Flavobacterium collinsii]